MKQLIDIYNEKETAILALEKINKKESDKYGIIEYDSKNNNLYNINSIVEKPSPKNAKSNLAVVGRYIFPPEIFTKIEKSKDRIGERNSAN